MDDISHVRCRHGGLAHVAYRVSVTLHHLEDEIVVVRENHPLSIERVVVDRDVLGSLSEFWQETDVPGVVAVILEAMLHVVFDVFIEK